jgi:uncharacterized protein YjbI with pentapeptide repeats
MTIDLPSILTAHRAWLCGEDDGSRADLSGADLSRADLSGADLRRADLSGAYLSDAVLSGAVLSGADLSRAVLRGAVLSRADLSDAVLRGAVLSGADLRGAVLRGAVLSGADLSRAVLSRADLSGANLSGARGIRHASVGWSGHGECGRTLVCTEIDGLLMFGCGCFWGDAESLQKYITDGNGDYAPSRRRAMWLCAELVRETSP